jgi:hypothetical protein
LSRILPINNINERRVFDYRKQMSEQAATMQRSRLAGSGW